MTQLDQAKVEEFGGRMMEVLNGGMLSLMTSLGHRTGLFDAMAGRPPSSSEEVAEAAGLNERYAREWLDTMVSGRIVEYLPDEQAYVLPAEHAALLTRAAGPGNMAVFGATIPLLGNLEDEYLDCFRSGGGVPYDRFDEFMDLWSGCNAQRFDETLISDVLPLAPEVARSLEEGIDVLEIGCGAGHSTNLMAEAFPKSRFKGIDFRDDVLDEGRAEAESLGLTNVGFESGDLARLDPVDVYDFIAAFDVIHDQAKPRVVLQNVRTALKPDGTFLMVDIKASSHLHENLDHPMAPFLYATSTMHCMTVSLALDGEGLGTMWGEQKALELLHEAGFTEVEVHEIEGDIFNNYYVARKQ